MSDIFSAYAHYYDLLYKDKDYIEEAKYVVNLLLQYHPSARTILELGCGTGKHSLEFVRTGYSVHGIDLSNEMIERAQKLRTSLSENQRAHLIYEQRDLRTLRLSQKFDVVIALFHVFSYQVTNQDLHAAFFTAHTHLNQGGLLIFDCWYGPGVLTDLPTLRVKQLEDEYLKVIRIAKPEIHQSINVVDVNYKLLLIDKMAKKTEEITETHSMRYLFQPEVKELLNSTCFELISCLEWLSFEPAKISSWNTVFVAKSKSN